MKFPSRSIQLPKAAPAEVVAAALIVRNYLDEVLREDRRVRDRRPLRGCDHPRVLSAFRVMEAVELSSKSVEA